MLVSPCGRVAGQQGVFVVERSLNTEIRQFIIKKFPLARKRQIQDSDALLETGMVDSQGVLEVVAFIEKEFSIIVEDEYLTPENFQSINKIAAFVTTRAKTAGSV